MWEHPSQLGAVVVGIPKYDIRIAFMVHCLDMVLSEFLDYCPQEAAGILPARPLGASAKKSKYILKINYSFRVEDPSYRSSRVHVSSVLGEELLK